MILKKIILDNIRSYKHQEIEFPKGSVLLSGDIGSGKTSILLGIEFALFGLQPGQRGSSLLRNGEQEGGVKIEFEIDDKIILVERTLKKSKAISQDYCAITIDGEKEEISVTELKNKILALLNYPHEFAKKQNILYKFTVYTPQEEMKQIISQEPETRMNTLRYVFGIDKYKRIIENAAIISSKIREEKRIKEALTMNLEQDKLDLLARENEMESKYLNLSSFEREFFLKKEKRKNLQEEKEDISRRIEERARLQQEVEKAKIAILNKNDSILNNKRIIEQLRLQIKELEGLKIDESKLLQIDREIAFAKKEKEKMSEAYLEINSEINLMNNRNEESRKLEKKISGLEICPTCLQNIDPVYRANVLNKVHSDIAENNKKLIILEEEKMQIKAKINKVELEISLKEKDLADFKLLKIRYQEVQEKQVQFRKIEEMNKFLLKDIELLKEHNENLKSLIFELGKFESMFQEKQKEFEDALKEERMADIKVAELKKEIDMFNKQIGELKLKLKRTHEVREELIYLTKLEDWLLRQFIPLISTVERNVMTKLKIEFTKLFEKWFLMLVADAMNVKLGDDFTPIVEQQDYEIDYAYLSGGERTAIALAYRLALNQVINSFLSRIKTKDIVILDEPTDGFSEQQLDKMRDVLQELNIAQLILVSHEQKIETFVDNIIRLKKEEGSSRID